MPLIATSLPSRSPPLASKPATGCAAALLLALFLLVDADVSDERNASAHGGGGPRLGVLDGDTLVGLNAELLAGVQVDGWVRLGARWAERSGSRVDVLWREEVGDAGLLDGSDDAALGGSRDNRHRVALLLELGELLSHARALDSLLAELESDGAEFLCDKVLHLVVGHLELVLLLQALEHAAEVVADKVLEQ